MSSQVKRTLLKDAEKNDIYPYTTADVIGTKNETSDLETDLNGIDSFIQGALDGTVLIKHASQADKLTAERNISLKGDVRGVVKFDGSKDVEMFTSIEDNSHQHTVSNVTGLQEELDQKLSIKHDHPAWASFGELNVTNGSETVSVAATSATDNLNLVAGANIVLEPNNNTKSIKIKAVLDEMEATSSNTLRGVKIQFDANKESNEQYIPVTSYGGNLEIGDKIDFHLLSSSKDFDARLFINPAGQLYYTSNGTVVHKLFHQGNMGDTSGLDADTVDGKHANEFASSGHNHDQTYVKLAGSVMTNHLDLANTKALRGKSTNGNAHELAMVDATNQANIGATSLPLVLRSSTAPKVNINGTVTEIYHKGNKPDWNGGIDNLPNEFQPIAHNHLSVDISDATAENQVNKIMKRDGSGNFKANQGILTSLQAGTGADANITKTILESNKLDFYAKTANFIQGRSAGSYLVFTTNGQSDRHVLKLNTDGTSAFGGNVSVTGSLTASSVVSGQSLTATTGGASITGNTSLNNDLTVNGAATLKSSLSVTGASTFSTIVANNTALFKKDVTVEGNIATTSISASASSTFGAGVTVTGNSTFNNDLTIRGTASATTVDLGSYCKLDTGSDAFGLANKNNANISSWYGFSVSNLCSGQTVAVGKPAFSVNARNGNVYSVGDMYAKSDKRVYHAGNVHISTADPSGGSDGDIWLKYE